LRDGRRDAARGFRPATPLCDAQALVERLATGKYHQAAVGSCSPQSQEGAFTAYRMAVLLYY
jgi:hypothetical protein